jgi:hypothetical protein
MGAEVPLFLDRNLSYIFNPRNRCKHEEEQKILPGIVEGESHA